MKLLDRGASPKLANDANATPLYGAINAEWIPASRHPQPTDYMQQKTSYLDLMKRLLDMGADPNARLSKSLWFTEYARSDLGVDRMGATPFWRAAYAADLDAMKLLVEHGANPGIPTMAPAGRSVYDGSSTDDPTAKRGKQKDPSGLPPLKPGDAGVYPIHAVAGVGFGQGFAGYVWRGAPGGRMPALKYLVEELHADVNARDLDGYTPLHHAAARGDNEMIQYLVSKGADPLAVARTGQTTVDMANGPVQRIQPFPETIQLLESLGAKNNHHCLSC
jgi:hypothetical protein